MIARKRFGQNFLKDTSVIQAIIHAIRPEPGQNLVEIGPGQGALTRPILDILSQHNLSNVGANNIRPNSPNSIHAQKGEYYSPLHNNQQLLTMIEIDRDLVQILKTWPQNLNIIEADALTVNFSTLSPSKIRLFGNLPYNISTPLLLHLLPFIPSIQDAHFMVQKEVAERIAASPGEKNYGRLSVMIQYYCETELLFSVGPHAFTPQPKVDSSVIRLTPHVNSPYPAIAFEKLESVVKQAFAHRRKTLKNNFKQDKMNQYWLSEKDWNTLKIDSNLRPEQLDISKYVTIAQFLL